VTLVGQWHLGRLGGGGGDPTKWTQGLTEQHDGADSCERGGCEGDEYDGDRLLGDHPVRALE
jgi:hypothetical protein